jgi:hypothetical protein
MIFSEDAWQGMGLKNSEVVVSLPSSFLLFYGFYWDIAVKFKFSASRLKA